MYALLPRITTVPSTTCTTAQPPQAPHTYLGHTVSPRQRPPRATPPPRARSQAPESSGDLAAKTSSPAAQAFHSRAHLEEKTREQLMAVPTSQSAR